MEKKAFLVKRDGAVCSIKRTLTDVAESLGMTQGAISKVMKEGRKMRNGYEVERVERNGKMKRDVDGFEITVKWRER